MTKAPRMPDRNTELSDVYWKYFEIKEANTPELLTEVFRLRYQVYCVEHPFEEPNDVRLEQDEADDHSSHALMYHRQSGLLAGTVRMVRPLNGEPERSFAIQDVCTDPVIRDPSKIPLMTTGEISRFCVPKSFRRRVQDTLVDLPANSEFDESEWRRVIPNMTLGLFEWIVEYSRRNGLTHWVAVMEPHFLRLLSRMGIHLNPVGDLVEYHGIRQPCIAEIESCLRRMRLERPDVWEVVVAPTLRQKEVA